MARDKGHLTDLQLRHWIKAGKPLAKADGDGLTFTLSAAGVAGWILRYRHGGRRRELTIGRYPDIGLAEARGIATLKRAEVQQGRNPAAEKQKAKATAARGWTVRDLAKDYRAKKLVSLAHSTQVSYGRHLKRVEKKLGALTVREIEASDVVALIEGAGLTWGESNMLLITTKCLFTHACGKRLINANPCHGIRLSALLGERPLNPNSAPAPDADARGTELVPRAADAGRRFGLRAAGAFTQPRGPPRQRHPPEQGHAARGRGIASRRNAASADQLYRF
jgi:Arm DNA-binding domain